jgi:hypothetical protein
MPIAYTPDTLKKPRVLSKLKYVWIKSLQWLKLFLFVSSSQRQPMYLGTMKAVTI